MNKTSTNSLLARLNLFDATLLVIGSVLGSGIFLTTGLIAEKLPSAEWILLVWLLGALITLFGGLTLAELGAMLPEAGGQYVYLREAYGPMAGFMYGWTTLLVTQTAGIAALAVAFAEYLAYFFPNLGLSVYLLNLFGLKISAGQLIALTSIILLTIINYFGIRSASSVQNFFTIIKILAIVIPGIAGLFMTSLVQPQSAVGPELVVPQGFGLFTAFGVALIAVLWTFDGWYSVNCVASEIKNVRKNLPLSLILGITILSLIYLLINYFYLNALPVSDMAGVVRIGEKSTSTAFGPVAGKAMSALILVSIFGCLSATIIFGPRIYYAMARDDLFFKSWSRVHPRYHSPSVAIIWQGIWAGLLCLTGTYEQLFTYVMFALLLFYVATTAAIFVLRIKKPGMERPYKVWGYPLVPVLFGLSMIGIMISTLLEKPKESLLGLLIIAIGLPVYYYRSKYRS